MGNRESVLGKSTAVDLHKSTKPHVDSTELGRSYERDETRSDATDAIGARIRWSSWGESGPQCLRTRQSAYAVG